MRKTIQVALGIAALIATVILGLYKGSYSVLSKYEIEPKEKTNPALNNIDYVSEASWGVTQVGFLASISAVGVYGFITYKQR